MAKKTSSYDLSHLRYVDYKDLDLLRLFLSPYGQIQGKRRTNLTAKQQRAFALAVKRARFMGLLPYIVP
jgi:small subunit ribosomal protein S18